MRIGAVARAAGVSRDTLRFYEKLGLIRPTRAENSYRRYAPETAQLVKYIRTAQKLGFSLAEIGASMPTVWSALDPDAAVAELLAAKVKIIDERIAELQGLKRELLNRVSQQCPMSSDYS
ncbi:MerR family transcriptional regulator [Herbaspirillum sp. SJZ107]|uniref:MerR family transcriptional regulator n=1 Tax=Herbaspirillum sp. SJZ107 TaxID=2572881 RepID=UPI0011547035|nr:MerR family transcriptional regulator [Herbaspirillum sp. SJZ107]TQK01176.1 DNA-binding transcriptional MerR regulator [Herbaspirillum sp. SJZ107]